MDCGVRFGAITAVEASPAASPVAARVGGGRFRLRVRGSARFPPGFAAGFQVSYPSPDFLFKAINFRSYIHLTVAENALVSRPSNSGVFDCCYNLLSALAS